MHITFWHFVEWLLLAKIVGALLALGVLTIIVVAAVRNNTRNL